MRQQSSFDPVCGAWERAFLFFQKTKVLRNYYKNLNFLRSYEGGQKC
ncbi:hypothetical protein KsCSTR_33490 [Candidatus Kuenenia stuttgartiensis]|uniref:Uncharacterized protein n=1 Tax=Kuenenia stuttgartiensis TaxID=174633 RepID=Q1Q4E5_KUEST|nr:hypothetical protein KsCSTR_33490 [Candidatus Kuenenia stuttgartiensis]CAJ74888.1 unknown protein [Candidatus Kuenenia stuttgartiensis]